MPSYPRCKYSSSGKIKPHLKKFASYIFYSTLLLRKPKRPEKNPVPDSVSVVFMASIGDFVVFCNAAQYMRSVGKRITVICKRGNGVAEFAKLTGLFDEIIELDNGLLHRSSNIRLLSQLEYEIVFCAPLGRHALPDVYACAIKANYRIFPDTLLDCSLPTVKRRIDKRADRLITINETLEIKRYTEFMRGWGCLYNGEKAFHLRNSAARQAQTLAVFPGAGGGKGKCWRTGMFAYVIKKLIEEKLIANVLILGGKTDVEYCAKLYSRLNRLCTVENLCGKTSISKLIDILGKCCLTLANDSGGAHISLASNIPTVVICGMWQYGRFFPDESLNKICRTITCAESFCQSCGASTPLCVETPAPCIAQIDCGAVLKAAEELLNGA